MQKIIAAGEEAAGMLSEMGAVPLSEAEKKEWLSMYRLLDQQIDSLIAEEARWRKRALLPTAAGRGEAAEKIAALCGRINREIDRLADLRQVMEQVIGRVRDPGLRLLLRYKYIEGFTFEVIADRMHYCWRQILRRHKAALQALPLYRLEAGPPAAGEKGPGILLLPGGDTWQWGFPFSPADAPDT